MKTAKARRIARLAIAAWMGAISLQAQSSPSMAFSTYFGGGSWDWGQGVAVDASGNTYLTGFVEGKWWDRQAEAFVLKVDPTGALVWSIRLGGSGWDEGQSLVAGAEGDVWVLGQTDSADFPLIDSWERLPPGSSRPFLAQLAADGRLVFSTVFGGSHGARAHAIAQDAAGSLYVGGTTASTDFPPGAAGTGEDRGYVLKIDPAGPRILWGAEVASPACSAQTSDFTVDALGRAYLAWVCQTVRLSRSGAAVDYVLPVGGRHIAADAAGNAYLLTRVFSAPYFAADVLVRHLDPGGEAAGTFSFGGAWDDWAEEIATDPAGNVYVVGETQSRDFPLKDPVQPECSNGEEPDYCWNIGFLTKLRTGSWEIVYSTYLGGGTTVTGQRDRTVAWAVAAGAGAAAVTGWTVEEDLVVVNAFQPVFGGDEDAFLVRVVDNQPPACNAARMSPATIWPPNGRMVPASLQGINDPDGGPVTVSVTAIRQDEPLSRKGEPDATGLGTATPGLRAGRAGQGDGRVYHLTFTATDSQGASCTGTATVCVPHGQGQGAGCGDGGPLIDSTAGR